jgi:DEAD/DEAH box helicase domain-containing protein
MQSGRDPFEVLELLRQRNTEAIIGQSRTRSYALAEFLRGSLSSSKPDQGALVSQPIIEAAHPFQPATRTMAQLAGSLLTPELVNALDGSDHKGPKPRSYRFRKEWSPHRHQHEAWTQLLLPEPRSVLVTSGTGSGKTECFLVPLLDDLARQAKESASPLVGVQAIALYPLNALIASQKERLSEWTAPFGGKIRFGLYNGMTAENVEKWRQVESPEEVLSRQELRANPPPILVTNVTMLEYMLARKKDQPIIDRSKGKLKWIILDEAHTHVGAAAAEITLLIRRVLEAFEVRPSEVRFVATSATIGTGETVTQDLRRYLCDVSGAPEDRVHVIAGERRPPTLPLMKSSRQPLDLTEALTAPDPEAALFDLLSPRPEVQSLVKRLASQEAIKLDDLAETAASLVLPVRDFADALSRARKDEDILAPLRVHMFHRAVPGLWSCVNPACPDKPPGWRFGKILHDHADHCPSCAAPVLEIVGCTQCGEAMLEGDEVDGHLIQPGNPVPRDEFADDPDREMPTQIDGEDDNESSQAADVRAGLTIRYLFPESGEIMSGTTVWIDRHSSKIINSPATYTGEGISLVAHFRNGAGWAGPTTCPHCHAQETSTSGPILRPFRFGAPSIILNSAPTLLEGVNPIEPDEKRETAPPGLGKRLLSFSDSRQGTARLAAKLEGEAERAFMRSFIYHAVQNAKPLSAAERAEKAKALEALRPLAASRPALLPQVDQLEAELSAPASIKFDQLAERMSNDPNVHKWIKGIWSDRETDLFSKGSKVADFLLIRELYRRPKRAGSIETLGLAQIRYPQLKNIRSTPKHLTDRQGTREDWLDFLSIILNFWVRNVNGVAISKDLMHWCSPKEFPSFLIPPGQVPSSKAQKRWPMVGGSGLPGSLPCLLAVGLNLNLDDKIHVEIVNELMRAAWNDLHQTLAQPTDGYQLDVRRIELAPLETAWQCSETGRVIDRCFRGISPYAARAIVQGRLDPRCSVKIKLPTHPHPFPKSDADLAVVENWLAQDPDLRRLRQRGIWTDVQDRAARGPMYFRSAEHSAQQPAERLRVFEDEFKKGELNLLNCSTTMEMGVDIGSVSTVIMTNVPPSIASYRQRVGRAGRRGQAMATSFTFCKDRPLDREVFEDPLKFLNRTMAAPRVALDSRTIVQRHVNALLLSAYVRQQSGEMFGTQAGGFFGYDSTGKKLDAALGVPAALFVQTLQETPFRNSVAAAVRRIVHGSVLEGNETVVDETREAMERLIADFSSRVEQLKQQETGEDAQRKSVQLMLRRLCEDFLLGYLADRGFLPGHGFPTDVVQFVISSEKRRQEAAREARGETREYRKAAYGAFPSRSLDTAIREYAPGADVVLDGLVHRSGGVTLNWKRPASDEDVQKEIQALLWAWQCHSCGAADATVLQPEQGCPACGSTDLQKHQALRPGGFMADWQQQAHTDVDETSFVAPEPVQVSMHGAAWTALALPDQGRIRTCRETVIIHQNAGPTGAGFAICLHCGRAEPDSKDAMGQRGEDPLAGHKPLIGKSDGPTCAGNGKPYAIRRNHRLVHRYTTDGAELQLTGLSSNAAALALGSAMREALARDLGIEPDEMGVAVDARTGPLREPVCSIFLFDRASGGAGFSTQLGLRIQALWSVVEDILDCSLACDTGCSNCVVARDIGDRDTQVDRRPALDWVRALNARSAKPPIEDLIAGAPSLSTSVLDELETELAGTRQTKKMQIQLVIDPSLGEGAEAMADRLARWTAMGATIELATTTDPASQSDPTMRLRLWGFAQRSRASLSVLRQTAIPASHQPIAALSTEGTTVKAWAARDQQVVLVGDRYGRADSVPIISCEIDQPYQTDRVEVAKLQAIPTGSRLATIRTEFNGQLGRFGQAFAARIESELKAVHRWPKGALASIIYEDRYCRSPLTIRLLLEACIALRKSSKLGAATDLVPIRLVTVDPDARMSQDRGAWGRLHHDFPTRAALEAVAGGAFRKSDFDLSIETPTHVAHARKLTLAFDGGQTVLILLDQGFGAWQTQAPTQFPAQRAHDEQTEALLKAYSLISIPRGGETYLVIQA